MNVKKKLSTWYFMIIFSLILLVSIVYFVMVKIEQSTQLLEDRISNRKLKYIVDREYSLNKVEMSNEGVPFLNKLTNFFVDFHDYIVNYKN